MKYEKNSFLYDALRQKQSLPLDAKIKMSKKRIREFYSGTNGKVFVAFSGGRDSTVLLHLVRSVYPNVKAVFVDTGLEYPEVREFALKVPNLVVVKPEMNFRQVIKHYGFPVVSKKVAEQLKVLFNPHDGNSATRTLVATGIKRDGGKAPFYKLSKKWATKFNVKYENDIGWYADFDKFKVSGECCNIMKKNPMKKYMKETNSYPFIGTMACDSKQREKSYMQTGCNTIETGNNKSRPVSFWTHDDVLAYIQKYNLECSKIYDLGYIHTGCMFCMFGCHLENEPNRFQLMKKTHPKLYVYCMNKLGIENILKFLDIKYK